MRDGVPDVLHSRQVEAMAGYGISAEDIATVLGISRFELERDYRKELGSAAIKANAKVAESLFRKATGEGREGVVAAIFWLKTRAGWRETSIHEVRTGRPMDEMSDAELDARIELLKRLMDERAAGDEGETQAADQRADFVEFCRRNEAFHRQVHRARLQVLSDRDHFAADRSQVGTDFEDFLHRLAEAEHQAALGRHVGRFVLDLFE